VLPRGIPNLRACTVLTDRLLTELSTVFVDM